METKIIVISPAPKVVESLPEHLKPLAEGMDVERYANELKSMCHRKSKNRKVHFIDAFSMFNENKAAYLRDGYKVTPAGNYVRNLLSHY